MRIKKVKQNISITKKNNNENKNKYFKHKKKQFIITL